MRNNKEYDIAIIGGGPAGMTAAIYGQRSNLKTCFIEKDAPGGKIVITAVVENYPGFKTIEGPTLALQMFNQATELGAEYIAGEAVQILQQDNYKNIVLLDGTIIKAKVVILGIGTENRKLDIPGEAKFAGRGVSYCAICDGPLYRNKVVAVIGSGNSACEESLYLSNIVSQVHLVVRGDKLKADSSVIDELRHKKNIKLYLNTDTIEVKGDKAVTGLIVKDKIKNETFELAVSAVFPFVGLSAYGINSSQIMEKTPMNFIIVDKNMKTSIDGIYAIGDIVDKKYRQISTAINDGTIAALSAKEYISKNFK